MHSISDELVIYRIGNTPILTSCPYIYSATKWVCELREMYASLVTIQITF